MAGKSISPGKPWKIDPAIDINRVSIDDVKLVFAQAEKRLDDTVKTGELIAGKTMTLMTLMAGLFVALSGFFISNWNGWSQMNAKLFVAIVGSVYILFLVTYMLKNVLPSEYFVLGSNPRELMSPSFYDPALPKDKIAIFMYMSEIENYDLRIEYNRQRNIERWIRFRYSVIALWIMPAGLGLVYIGRMYLVINEFPLRPFPYSY